MPDYSTLNLDLLSTYTRYSNFGGNTAGSGCAGDPPGYPSYFLRSSDYYCKSIYTIGTPELGERLLPVDDYKTLEPLLRQLWVPLGFYHDRTTLWMFHTYKHHQHCYNGYGDDMVIYPVPYWRLISAGAFDRYKDDVKITEAVKTVERLRVKKEATRIKAEAAALATPENHNAVRFIRKFYPEHLPNIGWINKSWKDELPMQWWETEAKQPSEENCARSQRWGNKHPFGRTHCQWCGRSYPEVKV